jgi:hypothetical protein
MINIIGKIYKYNICYFIILLSNYNLLNNHLHNQKNFNFKKSIFLKINNLKKNENIHYYSKHFVSNYL